MAFTLQDDDGTVDGANAYVSVAEFKEYHDDRGNSYAGHTDAEIEKKIVLATGYLDFRWRYKGVKLNWEQSTEWPRLDAFDRDNVMVTGVPRAVKEACSEYALRALSAPLASDPSRDGSGQQVASKSTTVGPVVTSVTFSGGYSLPRYPLADERLKATGLVVVGRRIVRA